MSSTTRNQRIRHTFTETSGFSQIGRGLTLVLVGVVIGAWVFGQNYFGLSENMLGYVANVSTELLGIIATVVVIDQMNHRRNIRERKLALFRQARSRSNDVALEAVDQLQHEDWWDELLKYYHNDKGQVDLSFVHWSGGIHLAEVHLENADLRDAHLQQAILWDAHLENANLQKAHLEQANFLSAHLENADLFKAHLENAILNVAHLQNANLRYTHLENADLRDARLQNADLHSAHLENANLQNASLRDVKHIEFASFNEKSVLPDAKYLGDDAAGRWIFNKFWTPNTDMTRYANPNHPDFWEPEWVKQEREQQQNKSG